MKHYLADLLTLIRIILAVVLLALAFTGGSLAGGFFVFVIAELTDAFDGTLATRYPFPRSKAPKYRKYAPVYDMVADALLAVALALFFIIRVNWLAGVIIAGGFSALSAVIELVVYGRFFGHPDTAHPGSLAVKNFPLAKKIILARRNLYLALLFLVAAWTLYASELFPVVKAIITLVAVTVCAALWRFLAQRRHHISRDAVDIEQKLSKNSPK